MRPAAHAELAASSFKRAHADAEHLGGSAECMAVQLLEDLSKRHPMSGPDVISNRPSKRRSLPGWLL
eukprot:428860-Rhodomonas_salina.2